MTPFSHAGVAAVFAGYPSDIRARLHSVRELIFEAARGQRHVGRITEALRWGQPSYLTEETGSGSTIRIDSVRSKPGAFAIYFHCQTTLVESFKARFGSLFEYDGNRALIFHAGEAVPEVELRECIVAALTYHRSNMPRDSRRRSSSVAKERSRTRRYRQPLWRAVKCEKTIEFGYPQRGV